MRWRRRVRRWRGSHFTGLRCPSGRFLEMHMYMTSALSKNDMKAIGLQMALDLLAKKEKRDSITGLRTRTQPGRPDWGKVRPCTHTGARPHWKMD